MTFWMEMLENQVLMSAVVGWVVAQVLKTIIDCALNKGFSPERLYGEIMRALMSSEPEEETL